MDPEEFLTSPFGSDALDEDVLSPDDILGEERVIVRHSYNLLCGLYEVQNVDTAEHRMMLVFPRLVGSDPDFNARFNEICKRLSAVKAPGLLELKDFRVLDGRFCIFYEGFHGLCLPDYIDARQGGQKHDSEEFVSEQVLKDGEDELLQAPPEPTDRAVSPSEKGAGEARSDDELVSASELEPPFSPAAVKTFLQKVGNALHRLHRAGIHHYSLTDSNILTNGELEFRLWGAGLYEMIGGPLFERLASAGIPPIIEEEQRRLLDPVEGLSPEMRRGELPDARSDLYSVAYIAYGLLTGARADTPVAAPSHFNPEFAKPWDDVLLTALSRDPKERQNTIDDFIAHLEGRRKQSERSALQRKVQAVAVKVNEFFVGHVLLLSALALVTVAGLIFSAWARSTGSGAEPDIAPRPVTVVRDATAATHLIRVSPSEAVVEALEEPVRRLRLSEDSELRLTVRDGMQRLRVRADGYISETLTLRPTSELVELEVALAPDWARPRFLAREGSQVFLRPIVAKGESTPDWRQIGEVGEGGSLDVDSGIMGGRYDLEVRHVQFAPVRFDAVELAAGQLIQLQAEQLALPGSIEVTGSPRDASVFLGSERVGVPPLRMDGLGTGEALTLSLRREGYISRERTVTLEPGEVLDVDFGTLERAMVMARIQIDGSGVALMQDARLEVLHEGEALAIAPDGRAALPLGRSTLTVRHPDYREKIEDINMVDGANHLQIKLEPLPGVLRMEVRREGAFTLEINGRRVESRTVMGFVPGQRYDLTVVLDGYEPVSRSFRLGANEQVSWVIDPPRIEPPAAGDSWSFPYQDFGFVWIAPGEARIGSPRTERHRLPNEEAGSGERPLGVLTQGFWMSETTVTQAFYTALGGRNQSHFRGDQRPVENLSWTDAVAFAERLTEQERAAGRLPEGYVYRLPTQIEWEYACRAGSETVFSWGNEARPEQANFRGVYPRDLEGYGTLREGYGTVPVKSFPPNQWGLYEMHGNVREFTLDNFNDRYPSQSRLVDWLETRPNEFVPVRGGGWEDPADRSRTASRERMNRNLSNYNTGFRLVLAPER